MTFVPNHKTKKVKKTKSLPKWILAIPISTGHGSGKLQKKLWRLTSDFVRIRDWHKYGKRCVATGTLIERWKDGDAGHYKSYSVCNGMFKFDEMNIHMQSPRSNAWGGMEIGHNFAEELCRRYGENAVWGIECDNRLYARTTINDSLVIDKMKDILSKMKDLPEKPAYYARAIELLERPEA